MACPVLPDELPSMHRLGVIAYRAGRLAQAEALIRQAIEKAPGYWEYHKDLGNIYKRQGRLSFSEASLKRAVSLSPGSAVAHYDLGIVYQISGRPAKALSSYQVTVGIDPGHAQAWNNMGLIYLERGERKKAIACFETAINKNINFSGAYCNLGMMYMETGQFQKSVEMNRAAIALDPSSHIGYHNMGNALVKKDLFLQAIACFKKGLEKAPNHPEVLNSLGVAYQKNGDPEKAIACFQKVAAHDPNAGKSYIHLYNQLRQVCDWTAADNVSGTLDKMTQRSLKHGRIPDEPPFMCLCRDMDESRHFQIAQLWGRALERQFESTHYCHRRGSVKEKNRKIRIGYLSNNFRNHPTTHLLCRMIGLHDRDRFKVCAYSCSSRSSHVYAKILQENCDRFEELFLSSDQEAAKRILNDKIDILVDLNGYTDGHRLQICALRPAPIQVRFLGMAGTTGAAFFDYLIGDRIVTPTSSDRYYSERLVRMPHTYQANSYRFEADSVLTRGENLENAKKGIVFCCFSSNYKFEERVFNAWMRILKKVPQSVLWLLSESDLASRNLRRRAAAHGVTRDRLYFAEKTEKTSHLSRIRRADVALDTCTVNGAATTSDALWAGVPVITLRGEHFASRMSASILTAVGLPELITNSLKQYEKLAVDLATDSGRLKALKAKLEKNKHTEPLFDTNRYVSHLENAYEQMWAIHEAGEAHRCITVAGS